MNEENKRSNNLRKKNNIIISLYEDLNNLTENEKSKEC